MRRLGPKRRGSVTIEAMLALPVMMVLFGAVSQVLITSQSRVHLEQAAYAAARSALVHKCPPVRQLYAVWGIRSVQTECFRNRNSLDATAQRKAEDAARWALIAAAPTNAAAGAMNCALPEAGRQLLTGGDRIAGRNTAVRNAMCYVFAPGNVTVELEWQPRSGFAFSTPDRLPIRATVTFRYPLSTPFRRFLIMDGTAGQRGDGTYWREGSASVTLL
jgi:hypothetical protein